MENLFNKIEPYIDKKLVGQELTDFENTLQTDVSLQKEVQIYQTMIAAIQAKESDRLRQKFAVMDATLDQQLQQEDAKMADSQNNPSKAKIIGLPIYKTVWFRAAAAILLVFAAYVVFSRFGNETKTPQLALEQYEVEYKGWKPKNNLQKTAETPAHGDLDKIQFDSPTHDNTPNTLNSGRITENFPNQEGVKDDSSTEISPFIGENEVMLEKEYQRAGTYFEEGNYKDAIQTLEQMTDSHLSQKHFRLGMTHYANQDLMEAIQSLKIALQKSETQLSASDVATAKWHLAMAYAKQKSWTAAKPYFNELANSESIYAAKAKEMMVELQN